MKKIYTAKNLRTLGLALGLSLVGFTEATAQISVAPVPGPDSTVANQLAQYLAGQGVVLSNVMLTGGDSTSVGFFADSTNTIGLNTGILLTTGKIENAVGPNNSPSVSHVNGGPAIPMLNALIDPSQITYDGVVLEFDVQVASSGLFFNYVFASDEYPEFACTQFNDVFGFFISGPGIVGNMPDFPGVRNLAYLDSTGTVAVSINTVNDSTCGNANAQYYVPNYGTASSVQYDGYTVALTAEVYNLIPGETYHLKIAIADAGDQVYDSGVFLAHPSLRSCPTPDCDPNATVPVAQPGIRTRFYPNPATDLANVVVTGLQNDVTGVEVEVTDLQGRVVARLTEKPNMAGEAALKINTASLEAGMYQYSVRTANRKISQGKFVVTH